MPDSSEVPSLPDSSSSKPPAPPPRCRAILPSDVPRDSKRMRSGWPAPIAHSPIWRCTLIVAPGKLLWACACIMPGSASRSLHGLPPCCHLVSEPQGLEPDQQLVCGSLQLGGSEVQLKCPYAGPHCLSCDLGLEPSELQLHQQHAGVMGPQALQGKAFAWLLAHAATAAASCWSL